MHVVSTACPIFKDLRKVSIRSEESGVRNCPEQTPDYVTEKVYVAVVMCYSGATVRMFALSSLLCNSYRKKQKESDSEKVLG